MNRQTRMSNKEVSAKLTAAIANERQAMHVVIKLIRIALDQRSYLDFGYSSAFEWLTKEHKYTNSCAQQRINSALLLRSVPEAENLLKTGAVNMSTLSKAQSILKAQEQMLGQKVSQEERKEIVKAIENKTLKETELILLEKFPDTASTVHREHKRTIDSQTIRYSVNFSTQVEADIQRAKEILSHTIPNASDSEVLQHALSFFLDAKDPLRKKNARNIQNTLTPETSVPGEAQSYGNGTEPSKSPGNQKSHAKKRKLAFETSTTRITAKIRREVYVKSEGKCSFQDPATGRVCGNRYQVEVDHIMPRALGGTNEPSNLRLLCRAHNFHAAEQTFGRQKMDQYRKPAEKT